jgi:hypothetical protein
MRAWWAYWITLLVGAVGWIAAAIVLGRDGLRAALVQPLWATILIAPIFLAGLNLVVFRASHEVVCRLEIERHPWLSHLVGRGYSARMFGLTGIVVLALGAIFVVGLAGGLPRG